MMTPKSKILTSLLCSFCPALAIQAATVDVEITNLTHSLHFTPVLVSTHGTDTDLFELGDAASTELQAMAEGGDISGLMTTTEAAGAANSVVPAEGPLAPATSAATGDLDTGDNTYLSIVAMLLPTNDGFVGLDAWHIPETVGTYTLYLNGYDAGTEANDEIINGGGAPGAPGIPGDPSMNSGTGGTGITDAQANGTIHIHRGNLGDTDPEGGASDLDSRIHRWLNPVAKVVVTVK